MEENYDYGLPEPIYVPEIEKIYTITLDDGTVIDDLRLNGNNFISQTEINSEIFDGNLAHVVINDGERDEVHENMELIQLINYNDEYWFILTDIPESEMKQAKLRSDVDYLAMMADIEI